MNSELSQDLTGRTPDRVATGVRWNRCVLRSLVVILVVVHQGWTASTLVGQSLDQNRTVVPALRATHSTPKEKTEKDEKESTAKSGRDLPKTSSALSRLFDAKRFEAEQREQYAVDAKRVRSINDRIQLLKNLMEEERKIESARSRPEANRGEEQVVVPKISTPPPGTLPPRMPNETVDPPVNFQPTLKIPDTKTVSGTPVFTKPINAFELGNSLFMTRNYAAAIKSYESMDVEKLNPIDASWRRCMLGCCYRFQKDFTNAETVFRELVELKNNSEFAKKHARWSLEHIANRRSSLDAFQATENELEKLLTEMKNERN